VAIVAAVATPTWYNLHRPVSTGLQLSGRIEGYETDVGAKIPGRVNFVAVREGDRVQKGEVIAKLDDAEIQAQLSEAKAQLDSAISAFRLAKITRDRYATLYREGAYNKQQYDQSQTALETAQSAINARQASVNAANKEVNVAQGALIQAQTTSLNPDIRTNKIQQLRKQINIAKSQLATAQADVKSAQSAEKQIMAQIAYLNVVSPIDIALTIFAVILLIASAVKFRSQLS
jgi:HlyD family secretion protein